MDHPVGARRDETFAPIQSLLRHGFLSQKTMHVLTSKSIASLHLCEVAAAEGKASAVVLVAVARFELQYCVKN